MPDRRNDPFRPKQLPPISAFEAMRRETVRNPFNRGSISYSGGTANADVNYPLREKFLVLNAFEGPIQPYSIFAVKKSGTLTVPPEPPIPVEAYNFDFGLVYITNGEFTIQQGEDSTGWCEVVDSFPVKVRYDPDDTTPKIGHILGPNDEGALSSKRAGFVVIAEPDTENYWVWVCKSNDQSIRVKVKDTEIKSNKRGEVIVVGEDTQQEPEVIQGPINAPGNCKLRIPKEIDDPNKVSPSPQFVCTYVLNLTNHRLLAGEIYIARPMLGLGLVIYDDSSGLVEFVLLEDRVRDDAPIDPPLTRANVIGVYGRSVAKIGDDILLVFPDGAYYDAVENCRGYALWYPENKCSYYVVLCQTLDYWISFQTAAPKGYSQQPIKVQVIHKKRGSKVTSTYRTTDWSAWDQTVVFDEQFKYPLPAGIWGKAVLDTDQENRVDNSTLAYHVISIEGSTGKIAFKMLTDRTRELDQVSGLFFGRATVVIQDIVGTVPHSIGSNIEVIFPDRLYLGAVVDCEGTAEYYASNDKYIVDECQELAAWIAATLLVNRNIAAPQEDLPVQVDKSGAFANAVMPPSTSGSVYARFRSGEFPLAKQGATLWALLDVDYANTTNNSTMRYYVMQCNQMSPLQKVLADKFCPGESANVTQYSPMFFHPFGQQAQSLASALNPLQLSTLGGVAFVSWDHSQLNWVVLNVKHSIEKVITGIKKVDNECKIAALYREFSMMTCKEADTNGCTAAEELPSYCVEFEEYTAIEEVQFTFDNDCNLILEGKMVTFCALGSNDPNKPFIQIANIPMITKQVVVTIGEDGDCAYPVYSDIMVLDCGDHGTEYNGLPFICITDCPGQGSGSGSG